ncbi:MCP four helix bundle domain-containing protein, partial [Myxococcota bacterium]|nr:MCP four helix bundle domain-containing protein [Myxococcota bacterium]
MRWYVDLSIRGKLLVSFGSVVALAAMLGIIELTTIGRMKARTHDVGAFQLPGAVLASDFRAQLRTVARDVRTGMMTNGDNSKWVATYEQSLAASEKTLQDLEAYVRSDEEKRILAETVDAYRRWRPAHVKIAELARKDANAEARALLFDDRTQEVVAEVNQHVDELVAAMKASAAEAVTESVTAAERATTLAIALLAGVMILGIGIAVVNARSMSSQVRAVAARAEQLRSNCIADLGRGIEAMSHGDVGVDVVPTTEPLDVLSRDELGQLSETLNQTIAQTRATIDAYAACRRSITALVDEAAMLTHAARDGHLSVRGDVTKFDGKYRDLVQGVNDTLEAVIAPVDAATHVLERVAQRDFTAEIDGVYQGDHARIKDALNTAIREIRAALSTIGASAQALAASSEELSAVATQIGGSSEETSTQSGVVSAAAEQVSK